MKPCITVPKYLAVALAIALAAGCGAGPARLAAKKSAGAGGARFHAPGQIGIFTQPESGTEPIVAAIDGSQRSVWLQIYMLTDPQVIAALGRAAARGLDVRVLLEESPYNPGNPNASLAGNKAVATQLEALGVNVGWTNPAFNFTHAKSMLVDGNTAYILTYNLTKAATEDNREFAIVDRALSDVEELKRIFLADAERKLYQPLDPDLVVSPNNARWRILGIIEQAKEELLVGVEVISDPEIVATLIEKRRAGVDVRVLVGGVKKVPANLPAARALLAAGVPTRSQSRPYLHAKYVIADGEAAYLGSINFSTNSLDENRELGLIIREQGAIGTMAKTWRGDWEKAKDVEQDAEKKGD
jgi:phosphatidylserine/phosphatidylglycerophosphate/cardiolipin synthase-like enzyme